MTFPAPARFLIAVLMLAGLTLTFAPQTVRPATALANTNTTSTICGVVASYTPATSTTAGSITLGSITYPIVANATLTNAAVLAYGRYVCIAAVFDAGGEILSGTVTTGTGQTVTVCGVVTGYLPATAGTTGYVTINGTTYPIAAGVSMSGTSYWPNLVGQSVCFQATLNAAGQVVYGVFYAQNSYPCNNNQSYICGVPCSAGYAYYCGYPCTGQNTYGCYYCSPNSYGCYCATNNPSNCSYPCYTNTSYTCFCTTPNQTNCGTPCNTATSYCVCNTANSTGCVYCGPTGTTACAYPCNNTTYACQCGPGYPYACGCSPNYAYSCSCGNVVNCGVPAGNGAFTVCGTVSGYIPATSITPGSITINGENLAIAPNVYIGNSASLGIGNNVCLTGTLNAYYQIIAASVSGNVSAAVITCGVVNGYTPATPSSAGSLIINGQTYALAPGVVLGNYSLIVNNATLCLSGVVNSVGQVISGSVATQSGTPPPSTQPVSICGVVSDYSAPTSASAGLLSIAGKTYSVAANAAVSGAGLLVPGTNVCVAATLDAAGTITTAAVAYNGALTVNVCGTVTAYSAATSVSAGTITIAGITFPIAAGTSVSGNSSSALPATLGVTFTLNGQGLISGFTVTGNTCTGQSISGPISAYVPPTATTVGSITIGGATYPVAVGTSITINGGSPLRAILVAPLRHGQRAHLGF